MAGEKEKFDGLAEVYDKYRPRYPIDLIKVLRALALSKPSLSIIDIGAGTGIATGQIIEVFGNDHAVVAVEISEDMAQLGKKKFPGVQWHVGSAEQYLEGRSNIDLIVAAQSFQWMDRPAILHMARDKLAPGGTFAVLQNNRDFRSNRFLSEYEDLLEQYSPGYDRHYRAFDFPAEIRSAFVGPGHLPGQVTTRWTFSLSKAAFVSFSKSSTQVQRAIATHGDRFFEHLSTLLDRHADGESLAIAYDSELFFAIKAHTL